MSSNPAKPPLGEIFPFSDPELFGLQPWSHQEQWQAQREALLGQQKHLGKGVAVQCNLDPLEGGGDMPGPTEPGTKLELGQLGVTQDFFWDQWETLCLQNYMANWPTLMWQSLTPT